MAAAPTTRLPSPAALLTRVHQQTGVVSGSGFVGLGSDGGRIGKASWVRDRRMDVASLLSPAASPHARRPAHPGYIPVAPAAAAADAAAFAVGRTADDTATGGAQHTPRGSTAEAVASPPPAPSAAGRTARTRCTVCAKVLSSRTNMLRHVRVVHERSQVLRCSRCPSAFLYACQLKLHTATVHHKRRPFPCAVCGRGFGTRGHAKEHLQLVHEKRRPFGCGQCDKRCRTRALLAAHTRAAHGGDAAAGGETVGGGDAPAPAVTTPAAAVTALPRPPPFAWSYGRALEANAAAPVWATAGPSYEVPRRAPIASR